jgi:hypothetical protein
MLSAQYGAAMPRGNPKRHAVLRLDPELMDEVRELAGPGRFTAAVEVGLRLWLAREKRRLARDEAARKSRAA